jgi:DNA replication protein DnaC
MQTVELKNLNLSILPENAQQELIDFYQFLIEKYVKKQKEISLSNSNTLNLKGIFNQYSDTSKIALENSAWETHLLNKHRHD